MKKILVVEDDPVNLQILTDYLGANGYAMRAAVNGVEGIAAFHSEQPDLMLIDVQLPRKSGFEVCQEVKADSELQATKILMLTAKGRDTEVAKGLAMGADGYMTKPFSTKDLAARVRQMLDGAA